MSALLNLLYDHRLEDVGATAVKFDAPIEGGHIQRRKRVPHLLRLKAARSLDRLMERKTGSR